MSATGSPFDTSGQTSGRRLPEQFVQAIHAQDLMCSLVLDFAGARGLFFGSASPGLVFFHDLSSGEPFGCVTRSGPVHNLCFPAPFFPHIRAAPSMRPWEDPPNLSSPGARFVESCVFSSPICRLTMSTEA